MLPLRYKWFWLGAGLAFVVAILVLALMPLAGPPLPLGDDKLAHVLAFTFLSAWFLGVFRPARAWQVAVALAAYGLLIEYLQSFTPYRSAEMYDVLADFTGIAVGWLLARTGLGNWCARVESLLGADPA